MNDYCSFVSDVHQGIYAIFSRNITSGRDTMLVENTPGGASRPEISRDGRTLAFVRRVRDKEALVVMYVSTVSLIYVYINHLFAVLQGFKVWHTSTSVARFNLRYNCDLGAYG